MCYVRAVSRLELPIEGMTCAGCANTVERSLNELDGVRATVNYATEKAAVEFDDGARGARAAASPPSSRPGTPRPSPTTSPPPAATSPTRCCSGCGSPRCSTLPVLVLAMVPPLQFDDWQWLSLTLAAPVVVWGALPFHRAAWANLRRATATMDTLISVGVLAAFGWSLYALFLGDAGMPGMRMELQLVPDRAAAARRSTSRSPPPSPSSSSRAATSRRAPSAAPAPRCGRCWSSGAKDVELLDGRRVPVEELAVGDRFLVRPGEKVATDGVVEEGRSALDQSLLTGEPVPVEVGPGSEVAGATVNAGGRLVVRATKVGADTALAQIARLVTEAQTGKAPVQRLADRVSGVFVPVVIGLSVATLGFWIGAGESTTFAFSAAVAVLIIACPCALGLATPTALLVGTGRGAQLGLLIKGPEILESTRRIDTIVLDKTGTVTTGRMTSRALRTRRRCGWPPPSRPRRSTRSAARSPPRSTTCRRSHDFAAHEGVGVEGVVEGRHVRVAGSRRAGVRRRRAPRRDRARRHGQAHLGEGRRRAARARAPPDPAHRRHPRRPHARSPRRSASTR